MGIKKLYSYLKDNNLLITNDTTNNYNIMIFDVSNLLYKSKYIIEEFNFLIILNLDINNIVKMVE